MPPIPLIAGMLSSIGPTFEYIGSAPSSTAFLKAFAASRVLNPIAQADGPCSLKKNEA
ncbi:Uncharacterised protein [Acinetobacter baumannii]|nr:Uncharacterised protein [Acinetobacter baumannii]